MAPWASPEAAAGILIQVGALLAPVKETSSAEHSKVPEMTFDLFSRDHAGPIRGSTSNTRNEPRSAFNMELNCSDNGAIIQGDEKPILSSGDGAYLGRTLQGYPFKPGLVGERKNTSGTTSMRLSGQPLQQEM